jgi:hypothetical protein
MIVGGEIVTVEPIEPIVGGNPHKTVFVLADVADRAAGISLRRDEISGLRRCHRQKRQ